MTNEQQIAQALQSAPPVALSSVSGPKAKAASPAPTPDDTWQLPGGTAWVYYGERNQGLTRPVILSDGFNTGPSDGDLFWEGLDRGAFPLATELRRWGRDVILLGYDDRGASLLENAQTAIAAILRAGAERLGGARLMVGGFSMGGLITRYALARMELQRIDHQVGVYWSWDTPHRGAYVPVSLQAFAHYIKKLDPRFSNQMNSPAARQMLVSHLENWDAAPGIAPERTAFLAELDKVGGWPRIPRLIGVADGAGSGQGNGAAAGTTAVLGTGSLISDTDLRTQPKAPDILAATLRFLTPGTAKVQAPDVPAADGAPGGTLDGFKILADTLNALAGIGFDIRVDNPVASHCFVPSVSAVSVRDVTDENLYTDIYRLAPDESDLDEFLLSDDNGPHTQISEPLASWLLDRLPD
jgi:hypothetical protein